MVTANDGVAVMQSGGNTITCSNGEHYVFNGISLVGPKGYQGRCTSIQEALGIVIGIHGGRKL